MSTEIDPQKLEEVGRLLAEGLDANGEKIDFARIGAEAFRAQVEFNKRFPPYRRRRVR